MLEPFMATRASPDRCAPPPPRRRWTGVASTPGVSSTTAGAGIFAQGDAATSVMYIERGSVRLSVVSPSGKEAVVAVLGPRTSSGKAVSPVSPPGWRPRRP